MIVRQQRDIKYSIDDSIDNEYEYEFKLPDRDMICIVSKTRNIALVESCIVYYNS